LPESLPVRRHLRAEDLRAEDLRAGHLRSEDLRSLLQAPADRSDSCSSGLPESLPLRRYLRAEDLRAEDLRTGHLRSEDLRARLLRSLLQAPVDRPDSCSSGLPESLPVRRCVLPGYLRACWRSGPSATGSSGACS